MFTNVNLAAPIGAIAFLGTGLLFLVAGLILLYTLARGQEKHICEIDCHLAYSIVDVRQTKTLGSGPSQATADGLYHIVTLKTRFDENTISLTRGNGTLTPNSRLSSVVDANGHKYWPSETGATALAHTEDQGTPLSEALRPGETYPTKLVFDLPSDVANPTLLLNEGNWLTQLIIGHENSPLHKKTRFQL